MRTLRALVAATALFLPVALHAQSGAAIWVAPGSRIRVTAPAFSSGPIYGHLVVLDGDSLVMVTPTATTQLRFDLATVDQVEVSSGRARLQWAGVGALIGGVVGALCGGRAVSTSTHSFGGVAAGVAGGFLLGAPVGAIVGSTTAPERWRTAWTPRQ